MCQSSTNEPYLTYNVGIINIILLIKKIYHFINPLNSPTYVDNIPQSGQYLRTTNNE
jgi:hypothetical protein